MRASAPFGWAAYPCDLRGLHVRGEGACLAWTSSAPHHVPAQNRSSFIHPRHPRSANTRRYRAEAWMRGHSSRRPARCSAADRQRRDRGSLRCSQWFRDSEAAFRLSLVKRICCESASTADGSFLRPRRRVAPHDLCARRVRGFCFSGVPRGALRKCRLAS